MSPILEVLIGMVFIYSLLSILVTQLNTVISQTLRLRAKHLLGAVNDIIHDEVLRAKIVTHPLIRLVEGRMILPNQKISEEDAQAILNGAVKAIEWINPKTFTNVLMSVIRVDSDKELFGALLQIVNGMPDGEERRRLRLQINEIVNTGDGIDKLLELVNDLGDAPHKAALNKALNDIAKEIGDMGLETDSNIALMAGLRNIKNPYFREAMGTILSTSKNLEEAEQKIETWFDDAMDRTSQAFKANMRWISLGVGLVMALTLNIDSLYIAQTLWDDPVLRDTVATAAQNADIAAMEAAVRAAEEATASGEETTVEDVSASIAIAGQTVSDLQSLRLPMGWSFQDLSSDEASNSFKMNDSRYLWNYNPANNPNGWLTMLIMKIFGLGITMVAVAQGAPFWFGILRQLSGKST
jgi:hypothetical protein